MAPTYIHDENNPRIEVGATFPNSKAFRVALRQLAIREDWSFGTQYSDTQRFRANCTDEDRPWRIHASKLSNTKTFMVKKLPSVIKELNLKSKGLHYLEARASPNIAEISGNGWRHTVNLEKNECSCRRWQICGLVVSHAHMLFGHILQKSQARGLY